jgi:hypothetical protein
VTVRVLPYLLAFALGLGAAGLTACGSKTNKAMLPAQNAEELMNHLDDVIVAIEGEDCQESARAVAQVEADLRSLPSGTSVRLQERLQEGVNRLKEQSADECQGQTETQTTQTETTVTETVPTVTETVPPTTTETVPPTTTETTPPTTTPTTETTPPDTGDTGGVEVVP